MWLCPVLSSSWYLFFYTDVFNGDVPIFERISQYTQYATQLTKIVKQLDTQLKILGFKAGYLWYHSYCKGVATIVAVGYTMYPPIVAQCIWYGLVLGGVKDKYLFREKAGDNYVKR